MSEPQSAGAAVAEIQATTAMLVQDRWADVLPAHIGPAKFQRWALLEHRAMSKKQDLWDKHPQASRLKTLVHQLRKWVP